MEVVSKSYESRMRVVSESYTSADEQTTDDQKQGSESGTEFAPEEEDPEKIQISKNIKKYFSHPIERDGDTDFLPELKLSIQQAEGTAEHLTPQDLVDGWNEICAPAGMPKVQELSATRKRKAARRITEHPTQDWWKSALWNLARSPFARGLSKPKPGAERAWRATFDWLIRDDTNPVKAFEGRYNG